MRKLRIQCKGRCRGNGKLYALLEIATNDGERIALESSHGEIRYPTNLISVGNDEYVLVLADLHVQQNVLLVAEDSKSGDVLAKARMTVFPTQFALASKLNGVARKALCNRIRNIDEVGLRGEILITCEEFVPAKDGYLIRGRICNRFDKEIVGVIAYSSDGSVLSEDCIFLNRSKLGSLDKGKEADTVYSVRVSSKPNGICLAAKDRTGSICSSFVSMKSDVCETLLDASEAAYSNVGNDWLYQGWFARKRLSESGIKREKEIAASMSDSSPLFSVVVPLFKTPLDFFKDMANSVVAQTYPKWELVLVNASPEDQELGSLVRNYAESDSRIKVVELAENLGITENTNKGIEASSGDYICFFDHDDVLEPDILFEYAARIIGNAKVDLLYCDEDKLFPNGTYGTPIFKPDFSLDMVRDNNYICHLLTVRKGAYDQVEPSTADLDGAQDHAMVLKISELGGTICHVPKVLYHWRISETSTAGNADSKPYATEAGIKAVSEHLKRVGISASVECAHGRAFRYKVDYLQEQPAEVSLIVPTRGDRDALDNVCTFLAKTKYPSFEVIFVVRSDCAQRVEDYLATLALEFPAKVVSASCAYSYSKWLNEGANHAKGACLVFAHDDLIPNDENWLTVLAGIAMRKDVGAVGTMTCNADGTIQQAGLSYVRDSIVSLSNGISSDTPGYIYYPLTTRNVAAVSGVCMATSREAYGKIGGFDECFENSYADVDFCFRADAQDLNVVYTAEARVVHYAISDGFLRGSVDYEAQRVFDKARLLSKWAQKIAEGDKFFNPNFSKVPSKAARYQL